MTEDSPGLVSYVSLGTENMAKATTFYDAVLATVGAIHKEEVVLDEVGKVAVAYGKLFPVFRIKLPDNQQPTRVGNGIHVGFIANRSNLLGYQPVGQRIA